MKKSIIIAIIVLLMASPALAWQYRNGESNEEYRYKSSTGTLYKYDLSKPGDRLKYEVDPGAQLRDSINPRVDIDRSLGQYGGGSE